MPDVLFGQSYFLKFDPKLWFAMQPYPPLGTLYAASFTRENGYSVALFDAMLANSEEEWAQALDQYQPIFAVIYEDSFNYLTKMCLLRMREAAFTMIEMAKERGITTVVSGSDASDHPESYLRQGADYVVRGEGEITLVELLDVLERPNEYFCWRDIGLAFLEENVSGAFQSNVGLRSGTVRITPDRPDIRDLDVLPFPAWDLVDVSRYRGIWLFPKRHGHYSMNMVTTRGCPFHCNWCAKPIWGQRYNSRSAENVVAELHWLQEKFRRRSYLVRRRYHWPEAGLVS